MLSQVKQNSDSHEASQRLLLALTEGQQAKMKVDMDHALELLAAHNFTAYMYAMDALGKYVQKITHIKKTKGNEQKLAELLNDIKYRMTADTTAKQEIALKAFELVWKDESLNRVESDASEGNLERDERHLAAKYKLNTSIRHRVKLGMQVLRAYADTQKASIDHSVAMSEEEVKKMDADIYQAVSQYKLKRQKIVRSIGKFFAGVAATAFGFAETGGLIFTLLLSFSMPIVAVIVIASIASIVMTALNWGAFKEALPEFFEDLFGKDRFIQGLTNYLYKGKKIHFSKKQKLALVMFSSMAAIPTALAIGIVGYASVTKALVLAGLGASAVCPPIAIVVATLMGIAMVSLFIKTFITLLQNKDIASTLKKPFEAAAKAIDIQQNQSRTTRFIVKVLTYATLGVLCIAAIGSIVAMSLKVTGPISTLVGGMLNLSPGIANTIGTVVGAVAGFMSRAVYQFKTTTDGLLNFIKVKRAYTAATEHEEQPPLPMSDRAKARYDAVVNYLSRFVNAVKIENVVEKTVTAWRAIKRVCNKVAVFISNFLKTDDPDAPIKEKAVLTRTNEIMKILKVEQPEPVLVAQHAERAAANNYQSFLMGIEKAKAERAAKQAESAVLTVVKSEFSSLSNAA